MSRSDLARDIGISRQALWNWQRAGFIPAPELLARTKAHYSPEAVAAIRAYAEAAR